MMKSDNYTKFILTVIAFMLTVNVAQNLFTIPTAIAHDKFSMYDCDVCDVLDDIERNQRSMKSTLSDIEDYSSSASNNAFGNYCSNCPEY